MKKIPNEWKNVNENIQKAAVSSIQSSVIESPAGPSNRFGKGGKTRKVRGIKLVWYGEQI